AVVHMDETPMLREGVAGNWAGAAGTPRRAMRQALQALQELQVLQMLQMLQVLQVLQVLQALQVLPLRARCVFTGLMGDKPAALIISDRHAAHSRLQPERRQVCRAGLLRDFQRMAAPCACVLSLWSALWQFVGRKDVAPTINAAEQALRMVVLKRKISGPTRSRRGDEFIANGCTAMLTCQRQGRDLLGWMQQAVLAWIKGQAPSGLMPQTAVA
ncbi:MAG: IS66 family transposase, partial [Rubrivivax sp.]